MALFLYFKRRDITRSCPLHLPTQKFAPLLIQISAKGVASMESTLLNRCYDWKGSCWAWCCSQLVHPRPLDMGVTSYHSHFKIRGHSCMRARRVWFKPDPTTNFLPRITTNLSIHENFTPPPKYLLYGILTTQKDKYTTIPQLQECRKHSAIKTHPQALPQ